MNLNRSTKKRAHAYAVQKNFSQGVLVPGMAGFSTEWGDVRCPQNCAQPKSMSNNDDNSTSSSPAGITESAAAAEEVKRSREAAASADAGAERRRLAKGGPRSAEKVATDDGDD